MRFEDVAARVAGIPFMTPELGRRVYEHIRSTKPVEVLELGTAHGVSAAYMAAALEANPDVVEKLVNVSSSATATCPAISSCTANMSSRSRS